MAEAQTDSEATNEAFGARLARYRDTARAAMLERMPAREPARYLYDLVRDSVRTSGKGIRPALCLATCGAFGGHTEDALTSAAAIEMLHTAFLVHDDVEDESELRRGHPTLHTRHGVPLAVNAGDAMQAMSMRLLRRNIEDLGPRLALRIFDEFDHMLMQSLEGQALELGWIRDNAGHVTPRDYLRMTLKKTCWYSFIHPCRIGAMIARPDDIDFDAFNAFGFYLGAAFQIRDDLLNLVGDERAYGKERLGDLWEGKRTLMLAHLHSLAADHERERLDRFLSVPRSRRLAGEVSWVFGQMQRYGCIDYARAAARELAGAAAEAFETAYAGATGAGDKAFVRSCIGFVIERGA